MPLAERRMGKTSEVPASDSVASRGVVEPSAVRAMTEIGPLIVTWIGASLAKSGVAGCAPWSAASNSEVNTIVIAAPFLLDAGPDVR